jgi:hypothetical protein
VLKMNNDALARHAKKMRRMPELLRQEVAKAAERNARDFAEKLRRGYADDAKLAETVDAYKVNGTFGVVWGVSVGNSEVFWVRWREFGTAAGDRVYRANTKTPGKVMKHPGADAQPTFFPTYRLNRKSYRSRMRSASTRAAKKLAAQR